VAAKMKRTLACQDSLRLNGGRLFVFGVLQRANVRNRNGRVYPKSILKREAERYYKTHVKLNRALGELDHPDPHSEHFRALTPENISHRTLDFYWEGDDLMGYVEVLPTPAGCTLRDFYLAGARLGMSSRGWATLKEEDGALLIQNDFELITFDFVSDPSTEGAFLLPVQERMNVAPMLPLHVLASELNMVKPRSISTSTSSGPKHNGSSTENDFTGHAPSISIRTLNPAILDHSNSSSNASNSNTHNAHHEGPTPPQEVEPSSGCFGCVPLRNKSGVQPVLTNPHITTTSAWRSFQQQQQQQQQNDEEAKSASGTLIKHR